MDTLAGVRAKMERKIKEPLDVDEANEAINEAVRSLWHTLILANVGDYISRQPPVELVADTDPIPFDELFADDFVLYAALVSPAIAIHEHDQAVAWKTIAEEKRLAVVQEVLQKSIRQETITRYNPSY